MKNLKILKQRENPLFNRKEVEIIIEASIAPKMSEAEALIAKEFSSHADNIKIKKIKGRFGSKNFIITAKIYNSKEDKDKIEPKEKKKKGSQESKESVTKSEESKKE